MRVVNIRRLAVISLTGARQRHLWDVLEGYSFDILTLPRFQQRDNLVQLPHELLKLLVCHSAYLRERKNAASHGVLSDAVKKTAF